MFNDRRTMVKPREVRGLNVVVLGLARQGIALSRWLVEEGARVTASDVQPADKLAEALHALDGLPIRFVLGGHPLSLLDDCDVLCLSGGVPIDLPIVLEAKQRGIPLSNDSQLFVERCPAPVIGITGSAGKTTTTTLVGEMCRSAGRKTWVGGNIGNPLIGDLNAIQTSDDVVMELSSFQLEVMTCSPSIAAVLNVTPNHLDRHPSMVAYTTAKAHILDFQTPGDTAVLGWDDPVARSLADRVQGNLWWFGAGNPDPLPQSRVPHVTVKGDWVMLTQDRETPVCALADIRLRGDHNVLNVLAACALAYAAGIAPEPMRTAITGFKGVAHRLQWVAEVSGVNYYDDSIATAPERLIAALKAFPEPIVLLVGGRDKHLPWEDAASLIRQRVRRLILFGEMGDLVERAVRQAGGPAGQTVLESVHRVGTLAEAVQAAAGVARQGDVVLLSPGGTSFDAFKDFAERGDRFQEYVRALGGK
jgi:UDP-N-acetylmuramoylalanine--D-glutamate ligase